jgi:hypothetical protein
MKYKIKVGTAVMRYHIIDGRWQTFVTTKEAFYDDSDRAMDVEENNSAFNQDGGCHYFVFILPNPDARMEYRWIAAYKPDVEIRSIEK